MQAEGRPPITLDDVMLRFAALADDARPVRHVRGTALAVGMDWLIRLPPGPRKERALIALAAAADLACEAYDLTD
ncbi:hypothetical protein [Spirillospora sp. NBC_01491]|uniref:hypothetical protein n=1 Tax=Spirillospora sp. NBC_01491 TaxID=2976007 RepID=UPI002E2FBDC1|nr:hypothetical protein [Spirillospora sp. NBC_01491]